MRRTLESGIIWLFSAITLIIIFIFFSIIWILTIPFDREHRITQKFTRLWGAFYVKTYPFWYLEVIDINKISEGKPMVAVSNHQSLLDILVLFSIYAHFIWVSKIENFRMPVLGWVMTANGYISLNRNDPRTFPKMFEGIARALKKNKIVMIFPEGTRSQTAEMGRFKDGAFKAAIENKVSILPIMLDGSWRALSKESKLFSNRTKITVKILDEIPYNKFPSLEPSALKEYVKGIINEELQKIRTEGNELIA
jgi:1-acyl-sn-glycerol-3-phosphate acyltransferase